MKLKIVILIVACLAIGYGLGNVHKSSKAKELTEKTEVTIKKGIKSGIKSAKEFSKKLSEELSEE